MNDVQKKVIKAGLATAIAIASANLAFAARGGSGSENGSCCGGGGTTSSSVSHDGGNSHLRQKTCGLKITNRTQDKDRSVHQGIVTVDGWNQIPVTLTFSDVVKNGKGKYANPLGTIDAKNIELYCIRGLSKQHQSSTGGNITNIKFGPIQKRR